MELEKVVDLHGHPTSTAIYEVAGPFIEAAWRRGYAAITLIHGSPDIQSHHDASLRGGTKWGLRTALRRGDWSRWVWNIRSVKHRGLEANSGAMTLALRPNPDPEPEYPWPEVSEPAYEYEGPWHRRNY